MRYVSRDFALGWLTVGTDDPFTVLDAAQAAGYGQIGIRIAPRPGDPLPLLMAEADAVPRFARQLDASGLSLITLGSLWLDGAVHVQDYAAAIEIGVRLGAQRVIAISTDPDPVRRQEHLAQLAALCNEAGIRLVLEFFAYSQVKTFAEARTLIASPGMEGAGILFDALHFHRSGGRLEELTPETVAHVDYYQVCDAPAALPPDGNLAAEARAARLDAGEGVIPMREHLERLPRGLPLEIEVPRLASRGLTPRERACEAMAAALAYFNDPPHMTA